MSAATITGSGNSEVTFEDQLQIKDSSRLNTNYGVTAKLGIQRWDEDSDGTHDITRNQQSLTAAERGEIQTLITNLATKANVAVFEDREALKGFITKEYDRACTVAGVMRIAIQDRITEALVELQEQIDERRDELARVAGSSRNCYVQESLNEFTTDALRKFAGLASEFDFRGIEHESRMINAAVGHQIMGRMQLTKGNMTDLFGLWGLLKGSNIDSTENKEWEQDADRTTFIADGAYDYREAQEDFSDAAGTYQGDGDAIRAQSAVVGSFVPNIPGIPIGF